MNKKTIITALIAIVAMSADAQSLNKDVERMQYVYALKMVINDSIWSGILETSACPNGYILLDADITMPRDSISSAYQTSWRLIINTGYLKTCQP